MENLAIQALLGAVLGIFFGNLRSRHIATDIIILVAYAAFFLYSPSYFIGAVIGGYLLGWGFRIHRLSKAESKDDSNDTNQE